MKSDVPKDSNRENVATTKARVLSQVEIEIKTLSPKWYESFNLTCKVPQELGNNLTHRWSGLLHEVLDERGGAPELVGSALIELADHIDCRRRDF